MTAPILRLDRVSTSERRGNQEFPLLRDASLTVDAGTIVLVYGARNSGKEPLLRIAAGLQAPESGRVLFDSVDVAAMTARQRRDLRRRVSFTTRNPPEIPELTVALDIMIRLHHLGGRKAARVAHDALRRAGVEDTAEARWEELSDADRTLVRIAKALAYTPTLMLLDDPLATLDLIDSARVTALLEEAAQQDGCGVLITAPDLPGLVRHVDDIYTLSRAGLIRAERPTQHEGDDGGGDVIPMQRRTS